MLEIGSGWGSLAIRAAQGGARVRVITLTREQKVLARTAGSPTPACPT